METKKQPETPDQITEFLLHSLYVLQSILHLRQLEITLAQIFEYSIKGTDKAKMIKQLERMLPHSLRCGKQMLDLLDAEEGQRLLEYLPLPYCDTDTVLWLLYRHMKTPFSDLSSAFRACDRSLSLRWKKLCRCSGERKKQNMLSTILETHLEDQRMMDLEPDTLLDI